MKTFSVYCTARNLKGWLVAIENLIKGQEAIDNYEQENLNAYYDEQVNQLNK